MRFSYRAFSVLSVLGLSQGVLAQKSASVLPKGFYRVRAVGISAKPVTQTLDANGQNKALLAPLERTLSAKEIAQQQAMLGQLYAGLNQVQSGLGDSLISVDLQPTASITALQAITAVEYGLTPKISLGIIVPTMQMDVKASFNARVNTQNAKLLAVTDMVAQANPALGGPLAAGMGQFAANTPTGQTFTDGIFAANGYQAPHNFRYTALGDIEVGAKYQYLNTGALRGSCLAGVRAPTASHQADASNLLDRDSGDGQWDLAFECANEFDALSFLGLGVGTRYTRQLSDKQNRAVLRDGQSGLPNLNNADAIQTLNRDLGDTIEGEVSARLFVGGWTLSGVLLASRKAADRYQGPAGYQVKLLEQNTATRDSRYEVGVNYSTIPAFSANKFPIPMEVKLAYNSLTAGENVARSAYTRMDLIVYF